MYHAVHNQIEARAPIRKMAILDPNGELTLLATYTCTPLVTIPLKDLKDGAHVVGKTIGEMGWGSNPVDVVTFDTDKGPMILLTNSHKSADLMSAGVDPQRRIPAVDPLRQRIRFRRLHLSSGRQGYRGASQAAYRRRLSGAGGAREMNRTKLATPALLVAAVAANVAAKPVGVAYPSGPSEPENLLHIELRLSEQLASHSAIRTPEGHRMAGNGVPEAGETVWRFVPAQAWRAATYALVTHPELEDSAGNRPCGPVEAVNASSVRCDDGTTKEFRPRDTGPKSGSAQHVGHD
jgi:hypothetical protein